MLFPVMVAPFCTTTYSVEELQLLPYPVHNTHTKYNLYVKYMQCFTYNTRVKYFI